MNTQTLKNNLPTAWWSLSDWFENENDDMENYT